MPAKAKMAEDNSLGPLASKRALEKAQDEELVTPGAKPAAADGDDPTRLAPNYEQLGDQFARLDRSVAELILRFDRAQAETTAQTKAANEKAEDDLDLQSELLAQVAVTLERVEQCYDETKKTLETRLSRVENSLEDRFAVLEESALNNASDGLKPDGVEALLAAIEARLTTLEKSTPSHSVVEDRLGDLSDRLIAHIEASEAAQAAAKASQIDVDDDIQTLLSDLRDRLPKQAEQVTSRADLIDRIDRLQTGLEYHTASLDRAMETSTERASVEVERLEGVFHAIDARLKETPNTERMAARLQDQLAELNHRIGEQIAAFDHVRPDQPDESDLANRVQAALEAVETRLQQPVPAPDPAPYHETLARFTKAMKQVDQRQAATSSVLEDRIEQLQNQFDTRLSSVDDTLSSLAAMAYDTDAIEDALRGVEARLAQPLPAVDLAPQRETLARFTTAMENVGQRYALASNAIEEHVSELQHRLDRFLVDIGAQLSAASGASEPQDGLVDLLRAVETRLAQPLPSIDMAPQRETLARFTTAMEHVGQHYATTASTVEDRVYELQNRLDAFMSEMATTVSSQDPQPRDDPSLEELLRAVEARLSAPLPTPDLSPQRETLARFTIAMENVARRHEAAITALDDQIANMHDTLKRHGLALEASTEEIRLSQGATSQNLIRLSDKHAEIRRAIERYGASIDPDAIALAVISAFREAGIQVTDDADLGAGPIADRLLRSFRFAAAEAIACACREQKIDPGGRS